MLSKTLPAVKAVRERTFTIQRDPDGDRAKDVRYTVRVYRPRIADTFGRWLTTWEVLIKNPDKTQIVIARGENAVSVQTLLSHVDVMLFALESAHANPLGTWANSEEGRDRLNTLELWAMYRRDARESVRSATKDIRGNWLGWRGVRSTRVAWARYFGWTIANPDAYIVGGHLRPLDTDNPTD